MKANVFESINNPYIVGNPIKSKEMFFGRDQDFAIIKEWIVTDGLPVILLIGSRRSGKTSILMQINAGRMDDVCESVFFDCNAIVPRIKKDADFSEEIGKSILSNPEFKQFESLFTSDQDMTSRARLKLLIDACINHINPKKLVILFDEIESLEKIFEDAVLTRNALSSIDDILTKPVFFVMTSSGGFSEKNIGDVFGHITQQKAIHELSREDTYQLIKKPVEESLNYSSEVVEEIYRLSGGKTFFTQHICHTLVNHVNAKFKKESVDLNDLGEVVDFIVSNPVGHIQESWKKYSDLQYCPKNTLHFLACLAMSLNDSSEFANTKLLLKTRKEQNFKFEKNELSKIIAWFKKNSRLIEWRGQGCRFRIDLLRIWIAHYYQTGEDIDEYLQDSVNPKAMYSKKLTPLLKKHNISYQQRVELDELQEVLGLTFEATEDIEVDLRSTLKLRSINWAQEYESSCLFIKNKFSEVRSQEQTKIINKTYVDSGRLSPSVAKEIRQRIGLKENDYKKYYAIAAVLIGIISVSIIALSLLRDQPGTTGEIAQATLKDDNRVSSEGIPSSEAEINPKPRAQAMDNESQNVARSEDERATSPQYPPEVQRLMDRNQQRLLKDGLSFSETVAVCKDLNRVMNQSFIPEQRQLFLQALEKSLKFIDPSSVEGREWLNIQAENIQKSPSGVYQLKPSFKQMVLKQEKLHGSLSTNRVPVDVWAVIKGEDTLCTKSKPCLLPLAIPELTSGNKEILFTNKKIDLDASETITIYPNQKYHLIIE